MSESISGKRFVTGIITAAISLIVIYVTAHVFIPMQAKITDDSAYINEHGELVLSDPYVIYWVVGEDKANIILDRMKAASADIRRLLTRRNNHKKSLMSEWESAFGDEAVLLNSPDDTLKQADQTGDWQAATLTAEKLATSYRTAGNATLRENANRLADTYRTLSRLKTRQQQDFRSLKPSQLESFFWTTPTGTILEVFCFALFGVLTNLLKNSAEYLRRGEFRSSERWIAYTKLVYGPIVAVMLVLAIIMGFFDLGDYETRANTLPILGFILGYMTRKAVNLLDRLGNRILGQASDSVDSGPKQIAEKRRRYIARYADLLRPASLVEMKANLKELAHMHVKAEVLARKEDK
ncbi:hypothetical protein KFE80_05345 [bacterium SCSIO 12696]|nr:hypothetical protein KFE80_05345 [bacterium SCSIO 12696]